ncbi:MAG: substrate-binding domain-containing protein [Lentisphaeria bacterium]|nr:substrate-binding domain-containing protein [Lentisphaeria bacterium]
MSLFFLFLWIVIWFFGMGVIIFRGVQAGPLILCWTVMMLSLALWWQCFLEGWRPRWRKWVGLTWLAALAGVIAIPTWRWYTVERFKQLQDRIAWHDYDPWRKFTKVVVVESDPAFRIARDLPRIDGAYALYPVYSGVVRALYERRQFEAKRPWEYLQTNGSDVTFKRLLDQEVDLIFSGPPSRQQVADAQARGMTYEITPFAKEAFVFFVNRSNPVENLTRDQIRGIYAGKISDWSQIDPAYRGRIRPFQRNQGSGSQTMLEKIMGDTPIMPPLREDRRGGMGGIINDVAGYRNYQEAIGFTFRFFSTEMFRNGDIKLLSIDGIAPTVENIRNGTYPFIADCCIITVKERSENVRRIVDFMFSPAGRDLVEKTGYVPVDRQ